jgi:hypothetical protein
MTENKPIEDYQKGSLQIAMWLGAPALLILIYMAFAWKEPSEFQLDVARFVAAVTSALLAYFVAGKITLRWEPFNGMAVSASAGFALFVLMAFVPGTNPFPPPPVQCQQWSVTGTLRFPTTGPAPDKRSIYLLIHPPEPSWADLTPRKLQYTLPIFVDPRALPLLQIESTDFFPKTFQLTNGKHDDEDPYTVTTDPKQRAVTISDYELHRKP